MAFVAKNGSNNNDNKCHSDQTLLLTPFLSSLEKTKWKPFICDERTKSYSYYLSQEKHQVFSPAQLSRWFRNLHPSAYNDDDKDNNDAWTDAYYKGEKLLRKTSWVILDENCKCEYGYSDTWQPISTSQKLNNVLKEITDAVITNVAGGTVNSCNLNYYPNGGGVGFHADDEFLFDATNINTRIISLSLCAEPTHTSSSSTDDDLDSCSSWGSRKFQVCLKNGRREEEGVDDSSNIEEIILKHGDLMTMEGMFQKYYFHSVWPGDSRKFLEHPMTQGERINLTWRTIVQHLDGSDECRTKICPLS